MRRLHHGRTRYWHTAALVLTFALTSTAFSKPKQDTEIKAVNALSIMTDQYGIEFRKVTAGCFSMGADSAHNTPVGQRPYPPLADETPSHQVCLDSYWLATYELTRSQWQQIMAEQGELEHPNRPQAGVSWEEAQALLEKLNVSAPSTASYRLPTEAEWEYACHANQPAPILGDATYQQLEQRMEIAWFHKPLRSEAGTRNVGELKANGWGFHDMLGNAWEWTADSYQMDGYNLHTQGNPKVIKPGNRHVIRGGSFISRYHLVRCGARNFGVNGDKIPSIGLRLVIDPAKVHQAN